LQRSCSSPRPPASRTRLDLTPYRFNPSRASVSSLLIGRFRGRATRDVSHEPPASPSPPPLVGLRISGWPAADPLPGVTRFPRKRVPLAGRSTVPALGRVRDGVCRNCSSSGRGAQESCQARSRRARRLGAFEEHADGAAAFEIFGKWVSGRSAWDSRSLSG
jgi:hypothetical protein